MAIENHHVADGKEILDAFFGEQNKPLTIAEWVDHEESIADIAAVLRRYVLPSLADRLEAAWKWEREALLTKQGENVNSGSAVYTGENKGGNAAAMREALLLCYRVIHCVMVTGVINRDDANKAMDAYHVALSAPPRNCDAMSLAVAKKVWFAKEIMPRLIGDLPLGKEISFEEWFVAPTAERKGDGDAPHS